MKKTGTILITGATGFVGSVLVKRLLLDGVRLRAAVLAGEDAGHLPAEVERIVVEPLSESSDFSAALRRVDTVIHLAARVHIMRDMATDPLGEFRKVNLHGTERLARQAAEAGVKRLVFMSTIGVNGSFSGSRAFSERDHPCPHNPYSVSKLEAEIGLRAITEKTGMELVIVRAPLIYGPGNPGNFLSLLRVIVKGIPLPLGSVANLKSFLYVENLADALALCVTAPKAAGQTYLVSDGEDVATPELIRRLARALDRPCRLLPFPTNLIRLAGKMSGKSRAVEQLLGSLQVDSSKIRNVLGWAPVFTLEQGLEKTATWFKNSKLKAQSSKLKTAFDCLLSLLLLACFSLPMLCVALLVKLTSVGPVLYWSDRVGRHNIIFKMPKFRTMRVDTPAVATHLLSNPDQFLTPVGKFLRKSSLDELPQLLSILRGDMSFVGPRPALFNQDDLIELRTQKGIHLLNPGLTGWAQINGRDELPIPVKVEFDEYYLLHRSILLDIKIVYMTAFKVARREGVVH